MLLQEVFVLDETEYDRIAEQNDIIKRTEVRKCFSFLLARPPPPRLARSQSYAQDAEHDHDRAPDRVDVYPERAGICLDGSAKAGNEQQDTQCDEKSPKRNPQIENSHAVTKK